MRNPPFCICRNKSADELRSIQRLNYCFIGSTIPLLDKSEISSLLSSSVAVQLFVWDLVGNHEDRFSHHKAQMYVK